MGNSIKYTAGTESNTLSRGNFRIGTGDVGKGPTSSTGFYQALAPPSGGYRIYLYNENVSGDIAYHTATNDSELITFTNQIANPDEPYTTVEQCFEYYNSAQTDSLCINKEIAQIPTDTITTHYDFQQVACRPISNNTISKGLMSDNNIFSNNTIELINGPNYVSTNGGGIQLDGINDCLYLPTGSAFISSSGMTYCMWISDFALVDSRDPFLNTNIGTIDSLRYNPNSIVVGGPCMEFFTQNTNANAFVRRGESDIPMIPNTNYPLFLCLNFINRGEGNYGCYLIMNNGNSGLIGGVSKNVQGNYYVLSNSFPFGPERLGGVQLQNVFLQGTFNMFSAYSKSFFPITTDVPGNDVIPVEIQQYYDATKGRFGL